MNLKKLKDNTIRKVWLLHFKENCIPPDLKGENDFVFGTKAAIYEVFDNKEIGITLSSLQCRKGDFYENRNVILTKLRHITKPISKSRNL